MIVIGADTHKSTHALAAVDAATGQLLREREIVAKDAGHLEVLRWAHELAGEIVWAIEDCRDFSHHLEQALLAAGERVVRVAPKLMGASRRGEREPGKSDQIDARAIARAVLREGIERFPVAFLDEDAMGDPFALRLPRDARQRAHQAHQPAADQPRDPRPRTGGVDSVAQAGLSRPASARHTASAGDAADSAGACRPRAGQADRGAHARSGGAKSASCETSWPLIAPSCSLRPGAAP